MKRSKDHWPFTKTYSHPRVYLECLIRKNVLLYLQCHWMPRKEFCSIRIADDLNYASFFFPISTYMNKTFIEEPFRKYILHLFFFFTVSCLIYLFVSFFLWRMWYKRESNFIKDIKFINKIQPYTYLLLSTNILLFKHTYLQTYIHKCKYRYILIYLDLYINMYTYICLQNWNKGERWY